MSLGLMLTILPCPISWLVHTLPSPYCMSWKYPVPLGNLTLSKAVGTSDNIGCAETNTNSKDIATIFITGFLIFSCLLLVPRLFAVFEALLILNLPVVDQR